MIIRDNFVSLIRSNIFKYPEAPFNPGQDYKEFSNFIYQLGRNKKNLVYGMVRDCLYRLGLDVENFNSNKWNPLKDLIGVGKTIVIKPNLVFDHHPLKEGVASMISSAALARPIIDYILLARGKECEIIIGDAPMQGASWDNLIKYSGFQDLVDFYKKEKIEIKLIDFREEIALRHESGLYYKKIKNKGIIKDQVAVDLGKESYFFEIVKDYKRLEITDYPKGSVSKHHNKLKNEYLIPRVILDSDLFINLPKLKTHKKAGITVSMKNLVGINSSKRTIAHHRRGIDEFPVFNFKNFISWNFYYYLKLLSPFFIQLFIVSLYRFLFKGRNIFSSKKKKGELDLDDKLMEGNWHGNDTIWRSVLDLNNIIMFADKSGQITKSRQRNYLSIVDGIIAMEGNGPMHGRPKNAGVVIGGLNPVATDYVASVIMGFDYKKIPIIKRGFAEGFFNLCPYGPEDVIINANYDYRNISYNFLPSAGWLGHIERDS